MRTPKTIVLTVAGALAAAVGAAPAGAAPIVTEATGPDAASIQTTFDNFRSALGAPNGGGPPAAGGRRQIGWDGVPDIRSAPSFMPENQFRNLGALFDTPGLGFEVSGDDDSDNGNPDADPDQKDFTDVNASYSTTFEAFSPERLFAAIGSTVTDTEFVVPGTDTPAETSAFGAVLSDVDQPGSTRLELFDAQGASLGSWNVPATSGDATFSFIGVRFDAGERAAMARLTTGSAPLGTGVDDLGQGGTADLVVMDDFVYAEPQAIQPQPAPPTPEPVADNTPPQVELGGLGRTISARELARGLKVEVTSSEEARLDARLTASARSVELGRAKPTVLLAEAASGFATSKRLKLRPDANLVRKAGSFKAKVRVIATDRAGNTGTVARTIRVEG